MVDLSSCVMQSRDTKRKEDLIKSVDTLFLSKKKAKKVRSKSKEKLREFLRTFVSLF